GEAVPAKHLRDRRVRMPQPHRQQPWPPAGTTTRRTDSPLRSQREQPRHPPWPARAIVQTHQRRTILLTRLTPPCRPSTRRRSRNVERGRRRPHRATVLDRTHQRVAASQSELRVTVNNHPGLLRIVSPRRPTASKEARMNLSTVHNLCRHVI